MSGTPPKGCPFCGLRPLISYVRCSALWCVRCPSVDNHDCAAIGERRAKAIEEWNKRKRGVKQ
jgi:hypothetical protein